MNTIKKSAGLVLLILLAFTQINFAQGELDTLSETENISDKIRITGYVRTSSGVGISGVVLSFTGEGTATTSSTGYFGKNIYDPSNIKGSENEAAASGGFVWSGTVTPSKSGYNFSPSSRSYSNITGNQDNQNFTGTLKTYYISASAYSGGSISPSGYVSVTHGSSKTFTIIPGTGYEINYVKVDGVSKGAISSYTFYGVNSYHSIIAYFKKKTYTITATAYSGGSISPSGSVSVTHGYTKTFTITPSTGYEINYVKVNGLSKGAISSYTFPGVTGNQSIAAYFKKKTYTITATASTGGSISPSGYVSVTHGYSKTFTITPGTGYEIDYVKVDGSSKGAISSYTFYGVNSYHSIIAYFAKPPVIISGVLRIANTSDFLRNEEVTFDIIPGNSIPLTTGPNGEYSIQVANGWSGTVKPVKSGYRFLQPFTSYSVYDTQTNAEITTNYTAYEIVKISGKVIDDRHDKLEGVLISLSSEETDTTGSGGSFEIIVDRGWTGSIAAQKDGYTFKGSSSGDNPVIITAPLNNDLFIDFEYELKDYIVSGNVSNISGQAIKDVSLIFDNGGGIVKTDANGYYENEISYFWSGGYITPTHPGYEFYPTSVYYGNGELRSDKTHNFKALVPYDDWTDFSHRLYKFSATYTILLTAGPGKFIDNSPGVKIVAFIDGECRSYVSTSKIRGDRVYLLMVYADEAGGTVNFQVLYENGDHYPADESILFLADDIQGTPNSPYQLHVPNEDTALPPLAGVLSKTKGVEESIDLTSYSEERDVIINWAHSPDETIERHVLQRCEDMYNSPWTDITEVANSTELKGCSYTDSELNSGEYFYRIKIINEDGMHKYSELSQASVQIPESFNVSQNYPNPFNPSTRINYELPVKSQVNFDLYSITGERVAVLLNGIMNAGYYTVEINSSSLGLASGVYLYRIVAVDQKNGVKSFVSTKKMILLK